MKKEHILVVVFGLFLLAYLLDAVTDPLGVNLATPYSFYTPTNLTTYPFTTASVLIRAIALFFTPLLVFSFFQRMYFAKGSILLVVGVLMQLYALQDVATNAQTVPLEWALAFSVAGSALMIPAIYYLVRGSLTSAHKKMVAATRTPGTTPPPQTNQTSSPDWLEKQGK